MVENEDEMNPEAKSDATITDGETNGARILIVDDDEFNRLCLSAPLKHYNYVVDEAEDGPTALEKIKQTPPDLVLLDVMLPGINGIDVCRKIKSDAATKDLPVLMVTVLDDQEFRNKAIEAGADDFLNKPVDLHEVILRVKNAVRAKRNLDRLMRTCQQLNELRSTQKELTEFIVHDIRSPLSVALTSMELLTLQSSDKLTSEENQLVGDTVTSIRQINIMAKSLLAAHEIEDAAIPADFETFDLVDLLKHQVEIFKGIFTGKSLSFEASQPTLTYFGDRSLLQRVVANLLQNAHRFTRSGDTIRLTLLDSQAQICIVCEDTGVGIAEHQLPLIFQKNFQGEKTEVETRGLGLAFCKMAIEAHEGKISVDSKETVGTTFTIQLPKAFSEDL